MQGIIGVIVSALVGAICTYFFNNLNTQKSNSYNMEREYIEKVCVTILQYLAKKESNDSLGRKDFEEIIKYIENVYENNLICITEKDKSTLNQMKSNINGDLNILLKSYTMLKDYFNEKVYAYRSKFSRSDRKSIMIHSFYINVLIIAVSMILSIICITTGVLGICGVGGWEVILYREYGLVLGGVATFSYASEPFVFLFLGIVWFIMFIQVYRKDIKKYIKLDS